MTIKVEDTLHGSVILEILTSISNKKKDVSYTINKGSSSSAYFIDFYKKVSKKNLNFFIKDELIPLKKIGLFIKLSRKRISPWRYTFLKEHQEEIAYMKKNTDETYVILIAGMEGIALLSYANLKKLLDYNYEETEWLSLSRKFNQYFRVDGNDSKKKLNVPRNIFPSKIVNKVTR